MEIFSLIFLLISVAFIFFIKPYLFEKARKRRIDYYRNVYLHSEAWQRKRYIVMKRDNCICSYCGAKATQVHHLKYAKYNIGSEPIDWLVSVCEACHERLHH
jgi:5-methylcytosine-specific restriction endonuclease McrA